MTRPRHRACTAPRRRNWLLPAVAAGLAVVVASSLSPLGTTAAWSDFVPFRQMTIYAGGPDFSVTGFEDLHEHEYEYDNLTDQATIVVRNSGDVTLRHFEASIAQRVDEGGNTSFYDNVSWKFTRAGDPQPTDWAGWGSWLYDLELAPGASATYGVQTTLDLNALGQINPGDGAYAVTEITVLARIASSWSANDTAWSIVAGSGIVQYVDLSAPPQIDVDTSNARWENPGNGYDLHLLWDAPPFPFGPAFTIYINGIAQNAPGETWYYYSNRYQIGPERVMSTFGRLGALQSAAPGVGVTVPITVEVRASGQDSWVARKTLWATGVAGNSVLIYGINPGAPQQSSAPAPMMAIAAPAPQPVAPQPSSPAPVAEGATPQPAPGTEREVEAPDAAGPAPETETEPAPAVPTEDTEVAGEQTTLVALDWPSGEVSIESATALDEPIDFELTDGVLQLAIPERFWEGTREVLLIGTKDGEHVELTIRLTRDESGALTYEVVEPSTDEPPADESDA